MVSKAFPLPSFAGLSTHIDPQWIATALANTGKASVRRRKLPAEQVVWLVIALALFRHQSIAQVVAELDLVLPDEVDASITPSAPDGYSTTAAAVSSVSISCTRVFTLAPRSLGIPQR